MYCKQLIKDLVKLGLWKTEVHPTTGRNYIPMKDKIISQNGSIQNIDEIPQDIKDIYKTIHDIKLGDLTRMARDRALFVDQSQSLNVYYKQGENTTQQIIKYLLHAWKLGLKTSSYYTRILSNLNILDFQNSKVQEEECVVCSA